VVWCAADDGVPRGPTLQDRAPDADGTHAAVVRGSYDEKGRPHGEWTGDWMSPLPPVDAFRGVYDHGERSGTWTFTDGDGTVAQGAFDQGWPHGIWTVTSPERTTQVRYFHGTAHGTYLEKEASGRETRGHFFDGTRNYEWDILEPDPVTKEPVIVKEEAYKYDTFVVAWDPRAQVNPIPHIPLPGGEALGPNAEGMCKVHATCATNAFFTALLAGGLLDPEKTRTLPILTDYADGTPLPSDERVVVVDSYHIDDMRSLDEDHAHGVLTLRTLCVVSPNDIETRRGEETIQIDLAYADDVWKLAHPLDHPYVRLDAFLKHLKKTDPPRAALVFDACNPNVPISSPPRPAPTGGEPPGAP